jgi:hypothetical protein
MPDNEFTKVMKQYRDEQQRRMNTARDMMMKALRDAEVQSVSVQFDGYGDSGSLEGITYLPSAEGKAEVPDTPHEVTEWTQGGKPKRVVRNYTLDELVSEACYGLLGAEHPGWEINEGSFGTFTINPATDAVSLTFNQRIESVETYDEEY